MVDQLREGRAHVLTESVDCLTKRLLHGRVRMESGVDRGTTLYVTLPAATT